MSDRNRKTIRLTAGYAAILLLCVCFLAAQDGKTANAKMVGIFKGVPITEKQLNDAADHQLANLEMQRLEAEANFARTRHRILELALDGIIEDRILTAESAQLGITKGATCSTGRASGWRALRRFLSTVS